MNQSDSFQTIEPQHSMSDRTKSIKSADTDKNAQAHRDRPFMERISERDRASGEVQSQNQNAAYGGKQGGHGGNNEQGERY